MHCYHSSLTTQWSIWVWLLRDTSRPVIYHWLLNAILAEIGFCLRNLDRIGFYLSLPFPFEAVPDYNGAMDLPRLRLFWFCGNTIWDFVSSYQNAWPFPTRYIWYTGPGKLWTDFIRISYWQRQAFRCGISCIFAAKLLNWLFFL